MIAINMTHLWVYTTGQQKLPYMILDHMLI